MTKAKIILFVCFCAAFVAGIAAGVALTRSMAEHRVVLRQPPGPPPGHGSWLEHELDLSPEQREQMHKIWSQVIGPPGPPPHEQRQALLKERDGAIRDLCTGESRARYEEVMKKYAGKLAAQEEARKKAFDEAVERTKQMLTEPQRKKYEELLLKHAGRHWRHGPPGGPGPDREKAPPPGK